MTPIDTDDTNPTDDTATPGDALAQIGDAFGRSADPWVEYEPTFASLDAAGTDVFDLWLDANTKRKTPDAEGALRPDTVAEHERVVGQWKALMAAHGRHPACPNRTHVEAFIARERAVGNKPRTIKGKIAILRAAFRWFSSRGELPHSAEFDPFDPKGLTFDKQVDAEYPHVSLADLRAAVRRVTHIRDRAIIVLQVKTGMRAGEVRNAELRDVNIDDPAVREAYPDLGTHPEVTAYPNAIYVPSKHRRVGNKSREDRVIPLDHETRAALVAYLLIRPTPADTPWLFLGKTTGTYLHERSSLSPVWETAFPADEWGENGTRVGDGRPITGKSHYGRHFFCTWFSKGENPIDRDDLRYLRGDARGANHHGEAVDTYIHRYYQDIEQDYRDHVFSLGL
ncbi:tyrosine-type recombinase/integrase [Halomarina rubra]|uniref:Tyrosine-type recombinase/integrase n=1 Tax=Halomarina rubra TaxID=2071873 RepID=A0ABD6ATT3_9EURY|nr:tyrosine-type recombinase/integrase [Halomarina rubra]